MATISENITRINQAKVDIKNAIIAKGGTVADSDKINVYAQAIEALPSGDETIKGIIDRSITKCNIPQGTTSIGNYAFAECTALTSVTIPDSVTTISKLAFSTTGLTDIVIPDSVTTINDLAFYNCSGLTSVTIGNGVTTISDEAFTNCTSLTSVTIGNGVTRIGRRVFSNCSKLTTITIKATTPPVLYTDAIPDNVTAIYVPSDSVNAYKSKSEWNYHASKILAIQE